MSVRHITLRPVRAADVTFFARWWRDPRLNTLTSGDRRPVTDAAISRYFTKILTSRTARHWMVVLGHRPIGHVTIRGQRVAEIQIMIGDPKLWGRGLGTAIVQKLQVTLRQMRATSVRMYVWRQNRRSIALGKKFGLRQVGSKLRRVGGRRRLYLQLERRIV